MMRRLWHRRRQRTVNVACPISALGRIEAAAVNGLCPIQWKGLLSPRLKKYCGRGDPVFHVRIHSAGNLRYAVVHHNVLKP